MTKNKRRGRPPYPDLLTPTEWRITHAAQHGMSNREIAERLGVSFDAVKFHITNIKGKLGLNSKQAIKQWFAIPKNSALEKQEKNMHKNDSYFHAIGQISRTVSDLGQSVDWYSQTLKLQHLFTAGTMAFLECDSLRIILNQTDEEPTDESIIYFRTTDIQATFQRLKDNSVEFINSPHMVHKNPDGSEEWMAFFYDLENRPLAIMSKVSS